MCISNDPRGVGKKNRRGGKEIMALGGLAGCPRRAKWPALGGETAIHVITHGHMNCRLRKAEPANYIVGVGSTFYSC